MSMLAYLPRWWIGFITNAAMIFAVILGYIAIKTFIPAKPPLIPSQSEYSVAKSDDAYVVYFRCQSDALEDFEAHIHRTIKHTKTGEELSLPANEVKFNRGRQNVTRLFYIPAQVAEGEWCSHAVMEWRPFLSLVDHKMVAKPACFTVPKK